MSSALETQQLLRLLQLASPALPVGAYSYSEGLETLVQQGKLRDADSLLHWIEQELNYGAMRPEAMVLVRAYRCAAVTDWAGVRDCNQWLSAFREAEELREQSWQMGRSLVRLLLELDPPLAPALNACGDRCHFAIAFAIAAANWQIGDRPAVLGYLQSWATNLVNAGIKLIPLGQTAGQKLLLNLCPKLEQATEAALTRQNHELESCNWGLAIASMNHETLYSRLFRS